MPRLVLIFIDLRPFLGSLLLLALALVTLPLAALCALNTEKQREQRRRDTALLVARMHWCALRRG